MSFLVFSLINWSVGEDGVGGIVVPDSIKGVGDDLLLTAAFNNESTAFVAVATIFECWGFIEMVGFVIDGGVGFRIFSGMVVTSLGSSSQFLSLYVLFYKVFRVLLNLL